MKQWQELTYAKRNMYLLLGAVVFILIAWKFSLSATYTLWQQNQELAVKVQQAENAPARILMLENQAMQWEQKALAYTASHTDVQKQLFASVSSVCGGTNVTLKELAHAGTADEAGTQVESFRVQLEGGYHQLLKATHQLEQKLKGGRVVSAQFQKVHDRRNKRVFLQATLYIQSIIKETDEKE